MSEPVRGPEWVGREVKLWVGLRLAGLGYPERGIIRQWLPDYPGGPTFEVVFGPDSPVPFACLKPEWVFLATPDMLERAADAVAEVLG